MEEQDVQMAECWAQALLLALSAPLGVAQPLGCLGHIQAYCLGTQVVTMVSGGCKKKIDPCFLYPDHQTHPPGSAAIAFSPFVKDEVGWTAPSSHVWGAILGQLQLTLSPGTAR